MTTSTVVRTSIENIPLVKRGKVRDVYDMGDALLIVATDRISCFDVVLPTPIPGKGVVLTQMSKMWFDLTRNIVRHHLRSTDVPAAITNEKDRLELQGRTMVVDKADALPVEAIVRGYLSGSAWVEYQRSGTVCGIRLPAGLRESEKLPEPVYTPSTKAPDGAHDENISFEETVGIVGQRVAEDIRRVSLRLYAEAAEYARRRGIIIADTKFEFGLVQGELTLIDEVLTPDSSRFWPASQYVVGKGQPSFDKQYVRDYLNSIGWEKKPPAPDLPEKVVLETTAKYREALRLLTQQNGSDATGSPSETKPMVSIVMGSQSDLETLKEASTVLKAFSVPHEIRVISAHRTPEVARDFGLSAEDRGIKVIIAGAGKSAHLAGVLASLTLLPIIGVPMQTSDLGGLDSLLSTVQMPGGIPVATVAIGKAGAKNAGLLAVAILALQDHGLRAQLAAYRRQMTDEVVKADQALQASACMA